MADEAATRASIATPERRVPVEPPPSDGAAANGQPPIGDAAETGGGGEGAPSPRRSRSGRQLLRSLLIPFLLVVILIAGGVGVNYYFNNLWYVSTDNAQVTGTPVPVGSVNAGTVESIPVEVGQSVRKGDRLAIVVLPSVSNSAAVRATIAAPFDGVVIGIPVGVGATVSPGQGIVTIVDPDTVYVNANVDETAVRRVQPGQLVDVHLDALNLNVQGHVDSITPASAGTFSLLPQGNSSGTFTKVTQLVPVKILVDLGNQPLPVGTSAEVKIHVAGH